MDGYTQTPQNSAITIQTALRPFPGKLRAEFNACTSSSCLSCRMERHHSRSLGRTRTPAIGLPAPKHLHRHHERRVRRPPAITDTALIRQNQAGKAPQFTGHRKAARIYPTKLSTRAPGNTERFPHRRNATADHGHVLPHLGKPQQRKERLALIAAHCPDLFPPSRANADRHRTHRVARTHPAGQVERPTPSASQPREAGAM